MWTFQISKNKSLTNITKFSEKFFNLWHLFSQFCGSLTLRKTEVRIMGPHKYISIIYVIIYKLSIIFHLSSQETQIHSQLNQINYTIGTFISRAFFHPTVLQYFANKLHYSLNKYHLLSVTQFNYNYKSEQLPTEKCKK